MGDYFDGVSGVEILVIRKRADDGYFKLAWFCDGSAKSLAVKGNFESDGITAEEFYVFGFEVYCFSPSWFVDIDIFG